MQDHTHKKKAALQKQKKTCIEHSHAIVITHTHKIPDQGDIVSVLFPKKVTDSYGLQVLMY